MAVSSTQALTSCTSCGIAFPLGARFCPSCGVPLDVGARRAPTLRDDAGVADPLIGKVIADRYRIMSLLGRGGMGVVYRVEHVHIGKLMAMKLLSGELAGDPATLQRFQREAKAVSKLGHPNTVQIFDFGESAHLAYLVMEYLPGRDLAALIYEQGPLEFPRVAKICAQVAGSVEEAHRAGIIHRDIKPENVMVIDTPEQSDFVKVLDFGIAKLRGVDEGGIATQRGHLIGTPFYMAPEQIRAEAFDHRVDIYALGALMYKAVTGVTPFTADTPMEVLGMHLNEPLVPARERAPERDIPEEADCIMARALAKDPADRYPTMAALRDDLLAYLESVGIDEPGAFGVRAGRIDTLATRSDVDRYEGRLLRTNRLAKSLGVLALVGAAYGAYTYARARSAEGPKEHEVEPNDTPGRANLLVPETPVRGQLGKRLSPTEGDGDFYRIELSDSEARVADIAVTGLPNIDLVLDVVEKGATEPLLVVDSGGVGEPERIPNIGLRADTYYVRVREAMPAPGGHPTENVSDSYTISLALTLARPDLEHELDDSFELAQRIEPNVPLQGLIGWAKDRDVYCAPPSAAGHVVEVSAVPGLDLVLAYLDRRAAAGQRIDRQGIGEGERLALPAASGPREPCFTVSARERDGGKRADPEHPYRIELR